MRVALTLVLLVGVAGALTARAEGLRPVRVTSGSMSPTIGTGDWIVVRDGHRQPARGDIVMFRFPLGTSGRAIKRVVALGGDRVEIGARSVTVDGRVIRIAGAPSASAARPRVETVPAGHVFVLGDNAARSIDSRSFGALPVREIVGRRLVTIGRARFVVPAAVGVLLGMLLLIAASSRQVMRALDDHPLG